MNAWLETSNEGRHGHIERKTRKELFNIADKGKAIMTLGTINLTCSSTSVIPHCSASESATSVHGACKASQMRDQAVRCKGCEHVEAVWCDHY